MDTNTFSSTIFLNFYKRIERRSSCGGKRKSPIKSLLMKSALICSLFMMLSCSFSDNKESKSASGQGPDALIGKWELVKECQSDQQLFDFTERSTLVTDSIASLRTRKGTITQSDSLAMIKSIDNMLEYAKNSFLDFRENGEVTVGALSENAQGLLQYYVDSGIYDIDYDRIRIEVRHNHVPVYLSGSFRWEIQKNMLYLYMINQPKGSYRVFRRVA